MSETAKPLRLAIRVEGDMINAYLARLSSMDNAILIGSIRVRPCKENPELFEAWKEIMTRIMTMKIKEVFGADPISIEEQPAPEHERGGNA